MILTGKILQENKKNVGFGNYHGIFNIDRKQIKEIFRTDSFHADVKILRDTGKKVNESEVKANFEAGLAKLKEHDNKSNKGNKLEPDTYYKLSLSPFFIINIGGLKEVLPFSFGSSIIGDFPIGQFDYAKAVFLTDVRVEIAYFYSEKGERKVVGFRASAGPLWQFPVSIGSINFNYYTAAEFGIGWYQIRGINEETSTEKWHILISTGPVFTIYSFVLSPYAQFDYIYDSIVPLYGIGLGITIGLKF